MVEGKCIYCKEVKKLNEEHAFPKALLQKCEQLGKSAPEWIIKKLCVDCNSAQGKPNEILVTKSPLALTWKIIRDEWDYGGTIDVQDSVFYNRRAHGINPVRLFYPSSSYRDFIVLHEEPGIAAPEFHPTPISRVLTPQLIITRYSEGQTAKQIRKENCERWNASKTPIKESDEIEGVYCLFGNTLIFPPNETRNFVCKFFSDREYRVKISKQADGIRSDLFAILPEESGDSRELKSFFKRLATFGTEEQVEETHVENKVFHHMKTVRADWRVVPYMKRAITTIAFHCFLYWHPQFSGHEAIFEDIKAFIQGKTDRHPETREELIAGVSVTEHYARDTNENYHVLRFYVDGNNIVCHIAFFTGLLVGPYASAVTLAGDRNKAMGGSHKEVLVPFYVHGKSEMMKRIIPVGL